MIQPKLKKNIPVYWSDHPPAAEMPRQDDEKTAYVLATELKEPQPAVQQHSDAVMQMLSHNHDETDEELSTLTSSVVDTHVYAGSYRHFIRFQLQFHFRTRSCPC